MPTYAEMGPCVVETDVDLAVIATLKRWLPWYLTQFETERGLAIGTFRRPENSSITSMLDEDEQLDHMLPAIIVTTAAVGGRPERHAGRYLADFDVSVTAVVRGKTPPETRWIAAAFGGTIRRLLSQQKNLEGFAASVRWTGGRGVSLVADSEDVAGRYDAAHISTFTVGVDNVFDDTLGPGPFYDPPIADNEPAEALATITDVNASVQNH